MTIDAPSAAAREDGSHTMAPARAPRRIPRGLQVLVIVIGAGILCLYLLYGVIFGKGETVAPTQTAAPTSGFFKPTEAQWAGFKTAVVHMAGFSASQVTDGKIALDDDLTVPVFSPYTGRVIKVFAKAGDQVKQGDPLLSIQAAEFVQAANDLVAALATDRTTKAQLTVAGTTEKRQHDLYLAQGGSLKDWQQSQSDLTNARGAFSSAEVALGAVRNRLRILGKSDRDVSAMEGAIDPLRFSPETVVTAPIAGTVTQRQVSAGQNIVPQASGGSTPVFSIGDTSRVWLVANAREMDAPQLHTGDAVEVRVLALPDRVFNAQITYLAASIDPVTHRLPLHAEVANADGLLKPEMFATFRIITGESRQAPAVPEQAVVYDPDGAHVWLAGPDKTLSIRQVKLGRNADGVLEVLEGLKAGDTVVTSGAVFIDRAADAG